MTVRRPVPCFWGRSERSTPSSPPLAAGLDEPAPSFPEGATGRAVQILVDVARLRPGDPAVLRALTRRERDPGEALRVL
jgi:hypothetical protein